MMRTLRGRRLVITGASGGIGRCLALAAGARGARVALAARSSDKLEALAKEIGRVGGQAVAVAADVTSAADRQRLLDRGGENYGGRGGLGKYAVGGGVRGLSR